MKNVYVENVLLLILLFVNLGCENKKDEKTTYEIILDNEIEKISISDFFETIQYIPLEARTDNLIGFIDRLYISDDKIYVLDSWHTQKMYVFDLSGKYIRSIGQVGQGPGEYTSTWDFMVDSKNEHVTLLTDYNKLIEFTPDGQFIAQKSVKSYQGINIFPLNNGLYAFSREISSGGKYLIDILDENFEIKEQLLPISKGWEKVDARVLVEYTGSSFNYLYAPQLSTKIYAIKNERLYPKYEFFIDDAYKLNCDKLNSYGNVHPLDIYERYVKSLFCFSSFFDLKNCLFVSFSMNNHTYWGMFNTENNTFKYVDVKNIVDKSKYGNDIYFMFQIDEETIAGISYPIAEDAHLGIQQKEISNPVVVLCKVKKEE